MLTLRCLFLITLFIPVSLILASLSSVVKFFANIGFLSYVFAMKFGTTSYSLTSKLLLLILGIKVPSVIFNSGNLIVSNHVSWLDGFILAASHKCTIVTKGELSSLFYVGFLLKGFGSISLDDNPANVLKALNTCHECLDNGISVLIFPEGTTGSQHSLGHFHSLFFDVAIKRSQPVCVAAIHYDVNSPNSGFPCWIGSEYLFHNMIRVLKVLPLGVSVKLGFEEIQSENYQRKELAEQTRTVCSQLLGISIETQPHLNEIAHNFVDSDSEFDVEKSHSLSIIKDILIEYWVNEGLMDSSEIDIDKTFTQLHIDSLGIVTLGIELERRINQNLNIKTAYLYDTPRKLAMYLDSE